MSYIHNCNDHFEFELYTQGHYNFFTSGNDKAITLINRKVICALIFHFFHHDKRIRRT